MKKNNFLKCCRVDLFSLFQVCLSPGLEGETTTCVVILSDFDCYACQVEELRLILIENSSPQISSKQLVNVLFFPLTLSFCRAFWRPTAN